MKKIYAVALAALLLSGCARTADHPCMADESARYRGTYRVERC